MKVLFTFLLVASICSVSEETITKKSDIRIPFEMKEKINNITIENFETFSATGNAIQEYKHIAAKYFYSVDYSDGFIIGKIKVSRQDNGETIINFDVKLPFQYCCSHNPMHCSKTKEEIKDNQKKFQCTGWHRADTK
ncbi:hypothetical protein [Ferruginibacter sp.]